MRNCILLFLLLISFVSFAQRFRQSVNRGWKFHKGDVDSSTLKSQAISWEEISIPHCYNSHDVDDDEPGYYRGDAWYLKELVIPKSWKNRPLFLYFEGINQVATVYINGKKAGEHIGGYTAFRISLNSFLHSDQESDQILIKVNNAFNEDIPPLTADFTFFGGIYRDVYLESVNNIHFDMNDRASTGIFISTPVVSEKNASVFVRGTIDIDTNQSEIIVTSRIISPDGTTVSSEQSKFRAKTGQKLKFSHGKLKVATPQLWSPENPKLYQLVSTVTDARTHVVLDELSHPVGFRWYSFTGDRGFFLNGKPYKIWGTSRHQDYPQLGNALPDVQHKNDVRLLKEMGGNFLRIAHYPQDPAVLEECDRLGILASVEIPVVNTITESRQFAENSGSMLIEMIRQNYNHPSVIMWAYMNEVLLRLPFNDDKPRQEIYFKNVNKLARNLDSLARVEDPSRVTMTAFHGNYGLYKRTGLTDIPMVTGWNLYQGWYSDNINGFASFLDDFHKAYPVKPLLVTEYGADGDPRVRSFSPQRFDKSVEYETYYHKVYYEAMRERPFVSGGLIWNLCDFSSETRAESMPHVNNKGVADLYRNPKDAYYWYQSLLKKTPFIAIGSRSWRTRSGIAWSDDSLFCRQKVEIYTNSGSVVNVLNNGKLIGLQKALNGIVEMEIPFTDGKNRIETRVDNDAISDVVEIDFQLLPPHLHSTKLPFRSLNISLGDQRFIIDDKLKEVWFPEKEYEMGSWGYVGGRAFVLENKRQPFGSDKNILGTENDPIYETQRVGIEQFRFDVPDGVYELTMHFAELTGGQKREALVYNLGANEQTSAASQKRSFDISLNGKLIAEKMGTDTGLVPEKAVSFKVREIVSEGRGIVVNFTPIDGETILNGIQITKIY